MIGLTSPIAFMRKPVQNETRHAPREKGSILPRTSEARCDADVDMHVLHARQRGRRTESLVIYGEIERRCEECEGMQEDCDEDDRSGSRLVPIYPLSKQGPMKWNNCYLE